MHTMLSEIGQTPELDFVWLELTNRCNLFCVHCYAESSPYSGERDILSEEDYIGLIQQIRALGCPSLQFIGGEPTLNRSLPRLIQEAATCGFTFIGVFTNLVSLPDSLLRTFTDFNIAVATSFYSHNAQTHDAITTHKGSFDRTVANMKRICDTGLRLRAGIIVMDQNKDDLEETWRFLESIGVHNIGTDHVRNVGRANESNA